MMSALREVSPNSFSPRIAKASASIAKLPGKPKRDRKEREHDEGHEDERFASVFIGEIARQG